MLFQLDEMSNQCARHVQWAASCSINSSACASSDASNLTLSLFYSTFFYTKTSTE